VIFLPPPNKRQTDTAIFACCAAAVAFYLTGNLGAPLRWLWQLASVMAVVLMILFVTRYQFTQHKYVLEDGDLIVVKIQGKKEQKVCHLSLTCLVGILSQEEYQAKKKSSQCYNYLQNIVPTSQSILHFEDGRDSLLILLETDDSFLQALKDSADPA
jgi:hypothetical protein